MTQKGVIENLMTIKAAKAGDLARIRKANLDRQVEWKAGSTLDAAFRGLEVGGEVGEVAEAALAVIQNALSLAASGGKALNILKKIERERRGLIGSRATVEQLGNEIGDAFLCLDLLASEFDLDLLEIVTRVFNAKSEELGLVTRL